MRKHVAKKKILITILVTAILMIVMINSATWLVKIVYPVYHNDIILKYTDEYNVDRYLIAAIIRVESKFYHKAKSSKGAIGLMQISPPTGEWAAKELGIENYTPEKLFDPETNIRIGCWYVSVLEKEFGYNFKTVVAAYNGGSGNVNKWLQNSEYSSDGKNLDYIPFEETRQYVEKVLRDYKVYVRIYR